MPSSRTTEMPQKLSQRGPRHVRTSSYDSDPLHRRPIIEKIPKINGERRSSPRSVLSAGPLNQQRKLGSRISDLENQLVQAQRELKNLKQQLSSANKAAKKGEDYGQKHSGNSATKEQVATRERAHDNKSCPPPPPPPPPEDTRPDEARDVEETASLESDGKSNVPSNDELEQGEGEETERIEMSIRKPPLDHELVSKDGETSPQLQSSLLGEKDKETCPLLQGNEHLEKQLDIVTSELSAARTREEETASKLAQLEQELESRKAESDQLKQDLENVKAAADRGEALELEMKQLRVQTEQWRKAADAAAAVLAGGVDQMNNRRVFCQRCCSMDKHLFNNDGVLEPPPTACGYPIYLDTPPDHVSDDMDDAARRKGSGIRIFGDLWRKKGQK